MEIRQQKGREIADKVRIVREGNLYLVPSQSGHGKYRVDAEKQRCSCPDFDFRRQPCKHLFAVRFTLEEIERTKTTVVEDGKTTVTETIKVTRKTYAQAWPAYNRAQTQEKRLFQYLLHQLCQGVGSPAQYGAGRKRLPLEDMIFAMTFKVYSTVSGRRFISDLRDAHSKGYLSALPCYNSIFNYFESETLTPYLQMLIEESSLPLASIEKDFAVDSSGLSTGLYRRWRETKWDKQARKYGEDVTRIRVQDWLKIHIMCGVQTNIVTSVEVSDAYASDSPYFKPLVEATAANFVMNEVSADRAYISNKNLAAVVDSSAMPYIPFKANSRANDKRHSPLWRQMYHFFSYNQERFMRSYHKRSNVETAFHMIKAKFGDKLRSKTKTAQVNEALCKVLCHNICCLIQSMHELNLKPKFYQVA
ncbi:MAG TPA: transposase [Pyrinomonadaceae bacterium]|jgi:transposase